MGFKPPMVFPYRSEISNHAYQFAPLNEGRRWFLVLPSPTAVTKVDISIHNFVSVLKIFLVNSKIEFYSMNYRIIGKLHAGCMWFFEKLKTLLDFSTVLQPKFHNVHFFTFSLGFQKPKSLVLLHLRLNLIRSMHWQEKNMRSTVRTNHNYLH